MRLTHSLIIFLTFIYTSVSAESGGSDVIPQFSEKKCRLCHVTGKALPQDKMSCKQCHNVNDSLHSKRTEGMLKEKPDDLVHRSSLQIKHSMVVIPAGSFLMGSNDRLPDEGPEHTVTLPAYWIDKYEVTNRQYKVFNDALSRRSPEHFSNRQYPEGKADHPVTFVSWDDANAYCHWAGLRLPTEQEWEKAARGVDGRMFPWGNIFEVERANTPQRWANKGEQGDTLPVGSFEKGKSPYGLHDMSGNVWEWVASWYQPHPGNNSASESYGERYRILKGGSWWDCSFYRCGISAPVFNRSFFSAKVKNASFGFRCAKDLNE